MVSNFFLLRGLNRFHGVTTLPLVWMEIYEN